MSENEMLESLDLNSGYLNSKTNRDDRVAVENDLHLIISVSAIHKPYIPQYLWLDFHP